VLGGVDRVEAMDGRSFRVSWRQAYAFADRLTIRELTILPRHLLEASYEQGVGAFANASYWADEFVGNGPFRLKVWERGSHLELVAFDRYFLGQPRTGRIIVRFPADENTRVAQILAGELDLVLNAVSAARGVDLASAVAQSGVGQFVSTPRTYRHWTIQYANHLEAAPLRDVRVRRALAHALDREQMASFATGGLSRAIDSWIPPDAPRYREAEPYITRYAYDARQAERLFEEAGWTRGGDGPLRDASGQTFRCDIRGAEQVGSLGAQLWKAVGVEATESAMPPARVRDAQYRATFPCVEDSARALGLATYTHLHSSNVMSAENGWQGTNRSGWSTPELDRAIDRFMGSPLESERLQAEREMAAIVTAELPLIPIYFESSTSFLASGVLGWKGNKRGTLVDASESWNAHQWEKVASRSEARPS
jgi:peptide/nickel transport system substrate-binding protein